MNKWKYKNEFASIFGGHFEANEFGNEKIERNDFAVLLEDLWKTGNCIADYNYQKVCICLNLILEKILYVFGMTGMKIEC